MLVLQALKGTKIKLNPLEELKEETVDERTNLGDIDDLLDSPATPATPRKGSIIVRRASVMAHQPTSKLQTKKRPDMLVVPSKVKIKRQVTNKGILSTSPRSATKRRNGLNFAVNKNHRAPMNGGKKISQLCTLVRNLQRRKGTYVNSES